MLKSIPGNLHKRLTTILSISIPVLIVTILLVANSPHQTDLASDNIRKVNVDTIADSAALFCSTVSRCPNNLEELADGRFIDLVPRDPQTEKQYSYTLTKKGLDCIVRTKLSTRKSYTKSCSSSN